MSSRMKLILDVDSGCDDADAIMVALSGSVDVEIVAITCVSGNSPVDQVALNTLCVLEKCQRLDIPVYVGASSPLMKSVDSNVSYCCSGSDGFEHYRANVDRSLLKTEPASVAMVKLAASFPGEISLLAVAPLTNVALALKLDANFGKNLKNIIVMGGSLYGNGNSGHVAGSADFNFAVDPEAASIVLSQMNVGAEKFLLLPLETCQKSSIEWEWCDQVLMPIDTARGRFHRDIWVNVLPRKRKSNSTFYSCDFFAAVVALLHNNASDDTSSNFINCTFQRHCAVEVDGTLTRGQLVIIVDDDGDSPNPCNVTLVTDLNFTVAKQLMLNMLLSG